MRRQHGPGGRGGRPVRRRATRPRCLHVVEHLANGLLADAEPGRELAGGWLAILDRPEHEAEARRMLREANSAARRALKVVGEGASGQHQENREVGLGGGRDGALSIVNHGVLFYHRQPS